MAISDSLETLMEESQVDRSVRRVEHLMKKARSVDMNYIFYKLPARLNDTDKGYLMRRLVKEGYEVMYADENRKPCLSARSAVYYFVVDKATANGV